jgi:predicted lipoprotein with Yx(FWY)xxD motif
VVACACASVAFGAPSEVLPTVKVSSQSPVGTEILVSSKGLTLYHFLREGKGTIKCTGSCSMLWLPLVVLAGAKPVAGAGLDAGKLGTVRRPDGRLQVTYNGLALYRDFYDKSGGQANGQGQDRLWYAVTPAGTVTRARVVAPASASAPNPASRAQPVPTGNTGAASAGGAGGCEMQEMIVDDDGDCK